MYARVREKVVIDTGTPDGVPKECKNKNASVKEGCRRKPGKRECVNNDCRGEFFHHRREVVKSSGIIPTSELARVCEKKKQEQGFL